MKLTDHFTRIMTPGRTFLPQVDGLRFIAIVGVIAFHVRAICSFHFGVSLDYGVGHDGLVNRTFEAGANGVQLFFAISGFILVLPFARHYLQQAAPVSLRAYFVRRLTRLEPPYIIQLMLVFLLCLVVLRKIPSHPHLYHNSGWLSYTLHHLVASLFYSNGFVYGIHPYPNIVLWSLEIEVQFYILAPWIARLFQIPGKQTRRAVIAGLILLSSFWLTAFPQQYRIAFSLVGNLRYFLVGFLVCDFYLTDWVAEDGGRHAWDVLFLPALVGVIFLADTFIGQLMFPWFVLVCFIAAFRGVVCRRLLSLPLLTVIGGMCYTIYMYHWFMISFLIRATVRLQTHIFWLDLVIQMAVMTMIIVAACAVLFALFERPFMRKDWPARVWNALRFSKIHPRPEPAPPPSIRRP